MTLIHQTGKSLFAFTFSNLHFSLSLSQTCTFHFHFLKFALSTFTFFQFAKTLDNWHILGAPRGLTIPISTDMHRRRKKRIRWWCPRLKPQNNRQKYLQRSPTPRQRTMKAGLHLSHPQTAPRRILRRIRLRSHLPRS